LFRFIAANISHGTCETRRIVELVLMVAVVVVVVVVRGGRNDMAYVPVWSVASLTHGHKRSQPSERDEYCE